MFPRVVLALLMSLLSISPIVALETAHTQGAVGLDQKCAQGYYPGFQTSSFQYLVPSEAFVNATGSFHHMEWYVSIFTPLLAKSETMTVSLARPDLS